MPQYIVKLTEGSEAWYLEWSTIVDAPITYGMFLADFKTYYAETHGRYTLEELEERLVRVERKGASCIGETTADELLRCNRAGPKESCLTKAEIIETFCRRADGDQSV